MSQPGTGRDVYKRQTIYTVLSFNLLALVAVIFAWIGTAKVLKGEVPNEA